MEKHIKASKRKARVRATIFGTKEKPRLSVHCSLHHIRAQVINDTESKTICSASDLALKEKLNKSEKAAKVGAEIAEKAQKAGIKKVIFDRGSKLYHGRIKALADSAREKGLEF